MMRAVQTTTVKHPGWAKVVTALQAKGLTQTQIKDKAGVSQGFISKLKAGKIKAIDYESGQRLFVLYLERVRRVKIAFIKLDEA